jgi:hypothetical protein
MLVHGFAHHLVHGLHGQHLSYQVQEKFVLHVWHSSLALNPPPLKNKGHNTTNSLVSFLYKQQRPNLS